MFDMNDIVIKLLVLNRNIEGNTMNNLTSKCVWILLILVIINIIVSFLVGFLSI